MAYWVLKALLSPIFVLLWRVRVHGRENVPKDGAAVLAPNHQAFIDSLFLPLVLRRKVTFIAKAEYFENWRTVWLVRAGGHIPIRRTGGSASQAALETALEVLGGGHLLALYPEGTRSPDGRVHRGRTGVARLVLESGAPVIPVGISGTDKVQPIGSRLMRPFHTVTIRFGSPIWPADLDLGGSAADKAPHGDDAEGDEECEEYVSGDVDAQKTRYLTDHLMQEIGRLSEREYVDEYIPVPSRGRGRPGTPAPPSGGLGLPGSQGDRKGSGRVA